MYSFIKKPTLIENNKLKTYKYLYYYICNVNYLWKP